MVGACRVDFGSGVVAINVLRASHPNDGLWQEPQVRFSWSESRGSKKSALPSTAFSSVYGLSGGNGISAGRRKLSREGSSVPASAGDDMKRPQDNTAARQALTRIVRSASHRAEQSTFGEGKSLRKADARHGSG